jgi:hypothetical protein
MEHNNSVALDVILMTLRVCAFWQIKMQSSDPAAAPSLNTGRAATSDEQDSETLHMQV